MIKISELTKNMIYSKLTKFETKGNLFFIYPDKEARPGEYFYFNIIFEKNINEIGFSVESGKKKSVLFKKDEKGFFLIYNLE